MDDIRPDAQYTLKLGERTFNFGIDPQGQPPVSFGFVADKLMVDGFTVDLDGFAAEVVRLAKARADTASRARKADLPRQCFFGCALGLGLALLVTRLVRGSQ